MLVKSHICKSIGGSIPKCPKVTDFMKAIKEQFVTSDKALVNTLMKKLSGLTFNYFKNVREHIMEMRDIAAQLKSLKVEISDYFLIHFILNSLPAEFGPFKISYNTHKENWSINALLTMCVQEEERLKHEKKESAHLVAHQKANPNIDKDTSKFKKTGMKQVKIACFFYKKNGHLKNDCIKYKKWFKKKDIVEKQPAEIHTIQEQPIQGPQTHEEQAEIEPTIDLSQNTDETVELRP
ncbi:hypothetical protein EZV62_018157 [Acer yangbiense]|uniref:Uncharacterized protein n=1 Tax=Acer yangbiense TaxID=1000413 RepID=A0A5C7HJ01_9ROSI|nr:hypothetical protein EZV62_018157 [Acer yangbiense]